MSSPPPGSPAFADSRAPPPGSPRLSQPLLPGGRNEVAVVGSDRQTLKAVIALQRCVGKMGRKVGHQKEDKHYDEMLGTKDKQIALFSMTGLAAMMVLDAVPWYMGETDKDTSYKDGDDVLKTVYLCSQLVVTLTTAIALLLIVQYYQLELTRKRREWSNIEPIQAPMLSESREDAARRARETREFVESYSFWGEGKLKWKCCAELFVNVVHPIYLLSENSPGIYRASKAWMLLRLYVLTRVMHTNSQVYKHRFEIVSSVPNFKAQGLTITADYTIKILFDHRTGAVLGVFSVLTVLLGGFGMFLLERNADSTEGWVASPVNWAGDFDVSLWFAYVTATTIGYGDYWPSTLEGRLCTVVIALAGFLLTAIFQAVITNNLKTNKHEKYIREYIDIQAAGEHYMGTGVVLIQRMWRLSRKGVSKDSSLPLMHKGNLAFSAVRAFRRARLRLKGSRVTSADHVLEDEVERLCDLAEELGWEMQAQQDDLHTLHRKLGRQLREVRKLLTKDKQQQQLLQGAGSFGSDRGRKLRGREATVPVA
eukprot:TRINITY_DN39792_c0_g1_i1.p1 TRINITY_DN39792_c0_g1~~TRINITY_DN39792_c0_g1_i1.p1  ORF type:complete len:538 (+),score=79.71 TRINITY_DN39792_c0_g1_i1:108-1721(+)